MIYETLSTSAIATRLRDDEYANWSREAAWAIADYLQELSDDIGEDIELDVVAIRCEWDEYSDLEEFINNYSYEGIDSWDDVAEYAQVILLDNGGAVVQAH